MNRHYFRACPIVLSTAVSVAVVASNAARAQTAPKDSDATSPTIAKEGVGVGGETGENGQGPSVYLPSLAGPIGLYRVSTADTGPVNHLRFALHGQYFKSSDFLIAGDTNARLDGSFSFGYTPTKFAELFGALLASSNRNQRDPNEIGRSDPEVLKSFGDLVLGGKAAFPIAPGFAAGPELGLVFLSGVSDLSFSPRSTSAWLGGVASYDLGARTRAPVRFHLNASYLIDNSSNLYDLEGASLPTQKVAMFAYGIGYSRARFAVGVDAPLAKLGVPIQPFGEYHAEIVTADANPNFAGTGNGNRDQQFMTLGLRAHATRGLSLDAGVDVRLHAVGAVYGPPLPPYVVTFGAAFPLDVAALARPVVVTSVVEKPAPAPTTGTVGGSVRSADDGKPVADASVSFVGRAHARIGTDPDGTFASGPLAPGPVEVVVTAAGFETTTTNATIAIGDRSAISVLLPIAKPKTGVLRGRLLDKAGRGLNGTLRFAGAGNFEARSDDQGSFSAVLPQGFYQAKIEAPGLPGREVPVDITAGQDRNLDVTLRPPNPDVQLNGQTFVLRVPIKFRSGAPRLDPTTKQELDGVAEMLVDHREIKMLRIQAHWSGPTTGSAADAAKKLTEDQAGTIKAYLIGKGVPGDRLDAVGLGCDSPLVPNLTSGNRTKNRRVELLVAN